MMSDARFGLKPAALLCASAVAAVFALAGMSAEPLPSPEPSPLVLFTAITSRPGAKEAAEAADCTKIKQTQP